jgi:ATP-dependent helicase/nuclease subunit B
VKKRLNGHLTLQSFDITSLTGDELILTPNRRLSAWLVRDYNNLKSQQGNKLAGGAWKTLQALPLDAWLNEQYVQMSSVAISTPHPKPIPRLLSMQQSRLLWQKIISSSSVSGLDLDGLVQLCVQARSLAMRWNLGEKEWDAQETPENRFFAQCHRAYLEQLREHNWADQADLMSLYLTSAPNPSMPDRVFLHGFNDYAEPAIQTLAQHFKAAGIPVIKSGHQQLNGDARTIAFTEKKQQFQAALQWILDCYQQQPQGRFAIVVPNLQQQRMHLQRLCSDIAANNPRQVPPDWQSLINITAGLALSQYPLVSHLLLYLRSLSGEMKLMEWGVLLKSPFFAGGMKQFEMRDRFIRRLQNQNRARLNLFQMANLWSAFQDSLDQPTQDSLGIALQFNNEEFRRSTQPKTITRWLQWLQMAQQKSGWLQERTLSSEEYQVNERLQESLLSLNELDSFLDTIDLSEFVREISTVLNGTTFQPQTETAPIQIMGTLEAAGMNFDAMWVCECESQQWPQPANANPMLPKSILRQHNMPGSGPERELDYAATMLEGFQTAAKRAIFSWGQYEGDNQLLLTPLLEDLPKQTQTTSTIAAISQEQVISQYSSHIQTLPEDSVGDPLEKQHAKGGSALIKAQSVCPFKCYAEYRLGIRQEDQLQEGVKASDRGSLIHRVLESFWRNVKHYDQLMTLLSDEPQLDRKLNELLDTTTEQFKKQVYLSPEALYQLERERTFSTVKQWLNQCDSIRQPFHVDNVEDSQSINVAGLQLSLSVDRIDQLADGSRVMIDYKTGIKNTSSWLGERPEEPQLPLYALLNPVATKGIYFGIVRSDKTEWQGLQSDTSEFLSTSSRTIKIPEHGWEQQMQQWQQTIEQLAQEYLAGIATVTPLNEATCQYCHLGPVCRIKEQNSVDR